MATDAGKPTRPYARGRDRKAELLKAAARSFAHYGYQGTSVAAIAAEADMTDAGVLHHFGSKGDLYRAVMESRVAANDIEGMLDTESDLEALVESMVAYVQHLADQPALLRFRAVVSGEALVDGNPAREILRAEHERALPRLVEKVVAAQQAGIADPTIDPHQAVLELMSLNEGLRHLIVAHEGTFDYPAVFENAARRWYAALLKPTAPDRATAQS